MAEQNASTIFITDDLIYDLERLMISQKFVGRRMDAIVGYIREGHKYNTYLEGCENIYYGLRSRAQLRALEKLWKAMEFQKLMFAVAWNELRIAFKGTEDELNTACRLSRLTE